MPASKKPKKRYRPKGIIINPIEYVVSGLKPASEEAQTRLKLGYHWAMLRLTRGEGTKEDWWEVANAMNVAIVLAEHGYGDAEVIEDVKEAMLALHRVKLRYRETGRLLFRGEELTAVNLGLDIHDAQMETATVRDIELAIAECEKRIANREFIKPAEEQTC